MGSDAENRSDASSQNGQKESDWGSFSKRLVEGIVPDVMRKTAAGALNTFLQTEEGVRALVGAVAKEAILYAREQIDRSRSEVVGLITRETHEFLERVDVGKEMEKVLSDMTVHVEAEIRFSRSDDGGLKPTVKVVTEPRASKKSPRTRKKSSGKATRKKSKQPKDSV